MSRVRKGFRQTFAVRYGFAVLIAILALLLRIFGEPLVGLSVPYLTFFLAAAGSAGFGGTLPGLVTVALGGLFAQVFLLSPSGRFWLMDPADFGAFIRYAAASTVLSVISGAIARSRERAKAAEESERQARLFSEQTLSAITDAVISTDAGERVQFINDVAARLTRWTAGEALGHPIEAVFRLVDEETGAALPGLVQQALQQNQTACPAGYAQLVNRDGAVLVVEASASPIQAPTGEVVGVVLVFRDVSGRRGAEEKRRTNEARLELAVQSTRMGVWEWDPRSDRFETAGMMEELYGASIQTAAQLFELVHPDDISQHREMVERTIKTGEPYRSDHRVVRPDSGKAVWVEESATAVRDAAGRTIRLIGVTIDVTDRKRFERELQETVQIYRAIGESIPFGVWICDAGGENTYASDSFLQLVGMTQAECSSFGWGRVLHPEDLESTIAAWKECVRTGDVWYCEHRFKGVDGEYHPILARGVPVRDAVGRIIYWAGINLDISRLKEVEAALRSQAEELTRSNRELEQFAFVASHDLQEPLRMVNAYTELLLRRIGDRRTPELDQYAGFIEQAVHKMERLIRDLLSFSRVIHGELEKTAVDANEAAANALHACRRLIAESGAEVTSDILPVVIADEGQLVQVFLNLVQNGIKYRKPDVPPRVHIGSTRRGKYALFWVEDNGIGFDPRHSETIFRLFKRLHGPEYPGTGLGLAICQRIVERYGGRIWAESAPDQGAKFYFNLPAAGSVARSSSPAQ